jgi:hypothetical protein
MAIALAALMIMKNFLLWQKPLAILSLFTIQEHPKETQVQFLLERPKWTQMQSLTHTTTCALVGGTIPD